MYPHKIYKLDNNLKIITLPNKTTALVILNISMKLGNDIETKEILEIGHFIEHLFSMFTSSKHPDGKKNREELSFRNIDLDAQIVNKEIRFTLNFHRRQTKYVFDLVSNALTDFIVDENMFNQEKNAVIEELNEIIKETDYKFETEIHNVIFKKSKRRFTQDERLINTKKMKVKDIISYYKKYFTSENYVIALFGNIDAKLFTNFKKVLSNVRHEKSYVYSNESLYLKQPIIYFKKKQNVSNLKLIIKLPFSLLDTRYYTIVALNDILTSDLNSLLLKKLRNQYGLIYDCGGYLDLDEQSPDLSCLSIETTCSTKNLTKVLELIIETLNFVKNNNIDEKYIKSYKADVDILKENSIFSKKPQIVINNYSKYTLWKSPLIKFEDNFKNLRNISALKLRKMANQIFNKNNMVVCYDGTKQVNAQILSILNKL